MNKRKNNNSSENSVNTDNAEKSNTSNKNIGFFHAFWKFSRPHTIRGTFLAFTCGMIRAFWDHPDSFQNVFHDGELWIRAILGLIALFFGNVFIVGINQIYDIKIDRINKPFLPIAAGNISLTLAWYLVLGCGIGGLAIVFIFYGGIIFWLYCFGTLLGMVYSVPPLRLKKNPVTAGLSIAIVRGSLLNFGVYYAVTQGLGIPYEIKPVVIFIVIFMTGFATVIAIAKDLPDIKGDQQYKIETFATRLGTKKISYGVTTLLLLCYVFGISCGLFAPEGAFNRYVMVVGHSILALFLILRIKKLDPENQIEIKTFYMFIWNLFYCEYVMYIFM
eukprot:TRINITY_DN2617_c0_g1_i1.p1 TRINITY_DN2617_c0_g1~~TRINITY_DN2617_c0_g1_i1.p1  ORF type:complete len:332 (-),score=104.65 TRINITY_DN2617_c0_g1_i1:110-1105(-)